MSLEDNFNARDAFACVIGLGGLVVGGVELYEQGLNSNDLYTSATIVTDKFIYGTGAGYCLGTLYEGLKKRIKND